MYNIHDKIQATHMQPKLITYTVTLWENLINVKKIFLTKNTLKKIKFKNKNLNLKTTLKRNIKET